MKELPFNIQGEAHMSLGLNLKCHSMSGGFCGPTCNNCYATSYDKGDFLQCQFRLERDKAVSLKAGVFIRFGFMLQTHRC